MQAFSNSVSMVKLYWYEGFTDNLDRRLSLPQTVGFSARIQLSGIFVLRVEFQSSSVDAVDMPETDGRGRSRAGGLEPAAATGCEKKCPTSEPTGQNLRLELRRFSSPF
jgi:hypothetical protein